MKKVASLQPANEGEKWGNGAGKSELKNKKK